MSDPLTLLLSSVAGAIIGAVFFGGLWWTVRQLVSAKQPAVWVLGSLILRTGVALAGFYLVAAHQLDRMLMCLLGFVVARFVVTRLTRSEETPRRPPHEASDAP